MKRILIMMLLTGCAYGEAASEEPTYGHTTGPTAGYDGGSPLPAYDPYSNLPVGCYIEVLNGGETMFEICFPAREPAVKWLVDPPPDGKEQKP